MKSWGKDKIFFLHSDDTVRDEILSDDHPMPIVLIVKKINDRLEFEQTEHTAKYLR